MIPQTRPARIRPEAARSASTESLAGSQPAVRPLGGARRSWQPMRTHLELQRPSSCETSCPVHSTSRRGTASREPVVVRFSKRPRERNGTGASSPSVLTDETHPTTNTRASAKSGADNPTGGTGGGVAKEMRFSFTRDRRLWENGVAHRIDGIGEILSPSCWEKSTPRRSSPPRCRPCT